MYAGAGHSAPISRQSFSGVRMLALLVSWSLDPGAHWSGFASAGPGGTFDFRCGNESGGFFPCSRYSCGHGTALLLSMTCPACTAVWLQDFWWWRGISVPLCPY